MPFLRAVLLALVLGPPALAGDTEPHGLDLHADFRLRMEQDWDSRRSDGTEREDRARARVRVRLGMTFTPYKRVSIGARLRSGSDLSQQSPHITIVDFDGGDTGDADFNLDKWYLRGHSENGRFSGWVGREELPFWKQNELFWDDDVTPAGLAGTLRYPAGESGELTIHAGVFSLPVGMQRFSGTMGALQAVYATSIGETRLIVAGGYFAIEANTDDPDAVLLLGGDGLRDYRIVVGSTQLRLRAGRRPLRFGIDVIENLEDYAGPIADQTGGHVLSVHYGDTAQRGHWLVGLYSARIETLAVAGSYAQDDWVRWGSATQTRGSNLEGQELRFAYAASSRISLVARLYVVDSITTVEDGKRFRVDFNYRLNRSRR
ncbi:MAG: hypothetical protein GTN89_02330 [Acidobacteria bacterium]|nr:hypothetical protein [Acidobacteriota bacterium]NIM61796.1 hypothetical protein [Acidobacteriota bacterium]NIO58207.1 hypothetical protein [Acidobacteriota bacterium]NIQ29224.1 hypothetical protein [Acidobacteriota bacterium]NIQ83801.1 hypothetical protein [Acidobacteriota bacterium]